MAVPRIVALFGPTAVGKTAVAVAVARELRSAGHDPVAVSADAMQVYRGLEVLTGARDALDQDELEHRLVGVLDVGETCSAGRFARLAHAEIDGALAAGRTPIVVGGTGLYLRAALCELDLAPPVDPAVRDRLRAELAAEGPEALHARLRAVDPGAADAVAPRDGVRITRRLELHAAGVAPDRDGPNSLWTDEMRLPTRLVALVRDREAIRRDADRRIDAMLAAGVADEVRRAAAAGASETARRAIGFEALLEDDVDRMRRDTRRYVKRQLTWLRRLTAATVVDLDAREAGAPAVHAAAATAGHGPGAPPTAAGGPDLAAVARAIAAPLGPGPAASGS